MYECAVSLLRRLLDSPFCMSSRGRWYDRLALDLDQHLKQRVEVRYWYFGICVVVVVVVVVVVGGGGGGG